MPSVSSEDLARIIDYFGPIHNSKINSIENLRLQKISFTVLKFHNCFDNETLFIYQKPQLEGGSINHKLFKEYQFLFYGICDLAMSTKRIVGFKNSFDIKYHFRTTWRKGFCFVDGGKNSR